jgi:hypothetical protein
LQKAASRTVYFDRCSAGFLTGFLAAQTLCAVLISAM